MNARERYRRVYSAYRECVRAEFSNIQADEDTTLYCIEMWSQFEDMCSGMGEKVVQAAQHHYWDNQNHFESIEGRYLQHMQIKRVTANRRGAQP